jgi:hypothetical protein
MRIVTNTKLATRNRSIATYLFVATFIVLIGGFFFVNQSLFTQEDTATINPTTLLLQVLVLPIAFIMTVISIRMTNLWARQPRPEVVLAESLKGLGKKSVLYNYHHIPTRHLLICPRGVFAIVTRWHEGRYSVENDMWRTQANAISRALSALRRDNVGNPSQEAIQAAEHAQKLLAKYAPDVKVQPLVFFLSPRAEVTVDEASVQVTFAEGSKQKPTLKDYLREIARTAEQSSRKTTSTMPLSDEAIAAFERDTL